MDFHIVLNVTELGEKYRFYYHFDGAYKLVVSDMTITPSANFQYSNDFWKWGWVAGDVAWEYKGLVASAQFLGRPLSFGTSVVVTGIAKMVDTTLSFAMDFGAGVYAHMNGAYTPAITLQDYITKVLNKAPYNFDAVTDPNVYKLSLNVTVKPMPVVNVMTDLYYTHDGLGVQYAIDNALAPTLTGSVPPYPPYSSYMYRWLNEIKDVVTAEYYVMVQDKVAATFYGIFTFLDDINFNSKQATNVADLGQRGEKRRIDPVELRDRCKVHGKDLILF